MNKILSLALKELKVFFTSSVAYIVLIVTLSVFHFFFFLIIEENREATLRDVFSVMEFLFIFIVPLLTMKSLAQEKETGTMEFLLTTPLTPSQLILGKYLGSLLFLTILILFTGVYYFIIEYYGTPDTFSSAAGYLGIWLEAALFVAIGIMASSWTSSQVIASISAYAILFLLYFSIGITHYFHGTLETLIRYLSTWSHSENFFAGLIRTADIVYYLSGIFLCLTLTRISFKDG